MSRIPVKCKTCQHSWNPSINDHIKKKYGCPNCNDRAPWNLEKFLKQSSIIHGDNYDYSKVSEEHINNGVMSNIPVKCNICNYEWSPTINNHINGKCGCPDCNNRAPWTLERFLEKAIEIHGNNFDYLLIAEQDIKAARSNLPIKCNTCQYKWTPTISSHVKGKYGCPNCSKQAPYTLELFLTKAIDIHGNNFDYRQITEEHISGVKSRIPIGCNNCLITWYPSIHAHINTKSGCTNCKNKTELKLFKELIQFFPNIIREFKNEWCVNIKTNCPLPFDFCLPDFSIIIELDGLQHFKQISNWIPPEITQKRDSYKQNCANKNGYSVIRILQEDVWYNKYDWLKVLKETIESIINNKEITNIFLHKNNEYTEFIENFNIESKFITKEL
jgi:very-short-patch-repair endonuclease/formylmethanofuran dehydrogenase subunit E